MINVLVKDTNEVIGFPDTTDVNTIEQVVKGDAFGEIKDARPNWYQRTIEPALRNSGIDIFEPKFVGAKVETDAYSTALRGFGRGLTFGALDANRQSVDARKAEIEHPVAVGVGEAVGSLASIAMTSGMAAGAGLDRLSLAVGKATMRKTGVGFAGRMAAQATFAGGVGALYGFIKEGVSQFDDLIDQGKIPDMVKLGTEVLSNAGVFAAYSGTGAAFRSVPVGSAAVGGLAYSISKLEGYSEQDAILNAAVMAGAHFVMTPRRKAPEPKLKEYSAEEIKLLEEIEAVKAANIKANNPLINDQIAVRAAKEHTLSLKDLKPKDNLARDAQGNLISVNVTPEMQNAPLSAADAIKITADDCVGVDTDGNWKDASIAPSKGGIPEKFKNTEEAMQFGASATLEQVTELKKRYEIGVARGRELMAKSEEAVKAGDMKLSDQLDNEGYLLGQTNQLFREAVQAAEKGKASSAERRLAVEVKGKIYEQPVGDTSIKNYDDLLNKFNLDDSDVGYGSVDASGKYSEEVDAPAIEKTATNAPARTPEELKEKLYQLHKFGQLQAVPRKIGGTGKKEYLGVFKSKGKHGEVTVREEVAMSDEQYIRVLAHELGHAIHFNVAGGTRKPIYSIFADNLDKATQQTVNAELREITHSLVGKANAAAQPHYYYMPTELFARFIEKMIVSPGDMQKIAPKTIELFEKRLVDKPILMELIEAAHSEIDKGVPKTMLLRDLRQIYQRELGKKVGNRAFDNQMIYRAMRERGKKVVGDMIENKFKDVKDNPSALFQAAEAIRVTRHGQPEFGTRDFELATTPEEQQALSATGWKKIEVRNLEDGTEAQLFAKDRYTPEQAKQIFESLSPEGQQLIKDFTAAIEEAKDLFNRELIKDVYHVNGQIEGWVHHYWEGKPITTGSGMKIKEKMAGAKQRREGAEGYVEDLRKAIHKALVELEGEKQFNSFINEFWAMTTKPLAEGQEPDPGWVEVVGDPRKGVGTKAEKKTVMIDKATGKTIIPKQARFQMPKAIYDNYKLIKGDVDEYSNVMKAVIALNRYWRINILSDLSSTSTNAISGALQYSAKILDDMYLEMLSGKMDMPQTRRNVYALISALTPKGWTEAPDWVYGADKSNFYGQFLVKEEGMVNKTIDEFGNKALALFGLVERYFKKAIVLSESDIDFSSLEKIDKTGLRDLKKDEKEMLARLIDDIDVYALDYDNIPGWLQQWGRNPAGQAVKPFAVYPYKIIKTYLRMAGDIFDRSIDWRSRVSKLLALTTLLGLMGMYGYSRRHDQLTPQGDETTPSWLRPKGRLPIGVDPEGREVFVRTSKYPFLSIADAGVNLALGQSEAALEVMKDTIGNIGPVGQLGLLGFGYINRYNMYIPVDVQIGDALASFVPFNRTLTNVSNMLDPNLRRKEDWKQSFTAMIPTTDKNLQDVLHGEKRTGKVPIPVKVGNRTTREIELKRQPEDALLYALSGLSVNRINPETAKDYDIRRIKNQAKRDKKQEK